MNQWDYVEAGFKVFGLHRIEAGICTCEKGADCTAAGKHPLNASWQFTPQWTDDQLECMELTGQFSTGFGVICDGSIIVDVDPRNGGSESYEKLCADTGIDFKADAGFVVATGGGGWHIYYSNQSTQGLRGKLKQYPGLDFKSSGFVVGAGSLHESGRVYEAESGHPCDLTPCPQKLLEMLEQRSSLFDCPQSPSIGSEQIAEMVNAIDPDCDYDTWVSVGMAVHHETNGEGFAIWDEWSQRGSKYNKDEMDHKWHSFGKCQRPITSGTLHQLAADAGYVEPVTFTTTLTDVPPSGGEPVNVRAIDTSRADGLLGQVINYINDNCRYPRERIAVGAAISTLGNIAGLRWRDEAFGVTANTFIFCVAGSSSGKEAVQDAQKTLQALVGLGPATYGKIKSEQELTRNLIEHQLSSYIIDELGIFLQKLENASSRGSASYLEGVIGDLMAIYSKADGRWLLSGDALKDTVEQLDKEINRAQKAIDENDHPDIAKRRLDSAVKRRSEIRNGGIRNPFLSMIGYTTGVTFNNLVTYNSATNGFIGRALIFEEKDNNPRAKRHFKKPTIDTSLALGLAGIASGGQAGSELRVEYDGQHEMVQTSVEALCLLDRIQDYLHDYASYHQEATGLEAIVRRGFEQILKISMVYAIGDGGTRIEKHVQWAYALVKEDIDNKAQLASGNMAQEQKQKSQEVLAKVAHSLDRNVGVTVGMIANQHRSIERDQISAALAFMEQEGRARREVHKPARGRTTEKWFAL